MKQITKDRAQTTMVLPRQLWTEIRHLSIQRGTSAVALVIEGLQMVLDQHRAARTEKRNSKVA